MNAKHITDITIENFRGLKKLELNGLQAVNLIVGQNNAGKTSLLEALTLVSEPEMMNDLPDLFRANRNGLHSSEMKRSFFHTNHGDVAQQYLRWVLADGTESAEVQAQTEKGTVNLTLSHGELPSQPEIGYKMRKDYGTYHLGWWKRDKTPLKACVISVLHSSPEKLVPSFADAVRSPAGERLMEQILNKVDSRIRTVRLDYADKDPFISVDIGLTERVPLPHVGQGIYRLVAILSALLGQRPQVCLIDEIENGIHYTVLEQLWKGIAEISASLGVQVFATTHSRECMEAASHVFFDEDTSEKKDFAVIQLMRVKDQIVGKVLSEARVDAALENDIELR
jgi:predicted ATPase